jgi:HEPN domain-containing protein/predicted nucleotidyltransferase
MTQDSLLTDPLLRRLVDSIVAAMRPHRVILFGSRARGEATADSDYDLVVEMTLELPFHEARAATYASIRDVGAPVDILLRQPGEIERKRDDPGFVDWDIAREGVVLYDANPQLTAITTSSVTPPDRVRERREPESVALWLERASRDLKVIDALLASEPVIWDGIRFHAQQAAEKYLKALIVRRMIRPPRTHLLHRLVQAALSAGCDLPDLDDDCHLLEPYAVDVRYPEQVAIPDDVSGRAALDAARRIIDSARRLL